MKDTTKGKNTKIDELFKAGAHFGFLKSRRHPSAKRYLYGIKNNIDIYDLEKTEVELNKILGLIETFGKEGGSIMFVGGKSEARKSVEEAGVNLSMPFVSGRWIGGTLTNFPEIKKRIAKLDELQNEKEKGELAKYTKKERLLIDRDIAKLTMYFRGLSTMKALPKIVVVVDPKKEHIAVSEAQKMKIPVVAIAGADCNLNGVDYAIPANDASQKSISYIMGEIVSFYKNGKEIALREQKEKEVKGE
ncbi:MAG: 30S ribosomal protein S2 [bacterium]|nr:30S ribosomal protein S2 [bacterium]